MVSKRNFFLDSQLAARGMQLVLWDARGRDGVGHDPQAAIARIARRIRPGAILISHEAGSNPRERLSFLGLLLEHLSREGYACILPSRAALRSSARAPAPPSG